MTTARRKNSARALASATLLAIAAPSAAPATTVVNATWLGATSGLWSDPTRWSTNPAYPNNDTPAPGTVYLTTINTPSPTPYTVTLDTDASVGAFTLSATGATFVQNANLTIGTALSHTSGTYTLAGGTLFGNSPTSTATSVFGSISVPTLATAAIVGVNLANNPGSATVILGPSSQLTITPPAGNSSNTYSTGAINLTTTGLPAKLVLHSPLSNGSGTPVITGSSLRANPGAALVTQSPDNLPITFNGGNSNGAVFLTPDTGSISLPGGLGSVNTVIKGGPNAIVGGSTTPVGFNLTIEAGSVTSPTAPNGTITIGSRPDIASVGMLVTSTLRPANISATSSGILSYDSGNPNPVTVTGSFSQAGRTYFSAAFGRTFYISADSFSPGTDNVYRFGGNGGWFQLSSPTNSPLLTGSSSLVAGLPRSLFGDEAAPHPTYITIKGPNSYNGPTTVNADAKLEVGNTSPGLTSPSTVTVDGTLAVPPTLYYNYSGALSVRRGGQLEIDASLPGSHDNFPDAVPVHLAGATLTYAATTTGSPAETVGGVFADAGSVSIHADTLPPNTTFSSPNLTIQTLTRAPGTTVQFDNTYTHNVGQSSSTPKVFLGNSSSLLVNGILPFATVTITTVAPQFLTYGINGVTGTNGTTVDINAASPTTNVTTASTTLTGDRTINALRTYNASGTPNTINLAGHTLTLTSGCLITTSAATVSNGALTAASPELFLHTMRSPDGDLPLTISARITDSPAGPVSLVKDGSNTLVLNPPPSPAAVGNTYTGGTYVNEGTLRTLDSLPAGPVFLSDATLDLRSNVAGRLMVPGVLTASSSALGASTLHLADAAAGTFGGGPLRVSALTVSPDSTLVLTRSDLHSLVVDTVLDVRGAVLRASDGASLTLGATGYYQDNATSALTNDPAAPAMPSFRFATGNQITMNAVTRGVRLSAEPSSINGAPTTLTYAGKLYSDNYDAELSATGNSKLVVDPAATLDTSRGFAGPTYDSHTLTLSGTGTVEFSAGFTLMQSVNSKTLNDVGSALLRLTGGVTFVSNSSNNLPDHPDIAAGPRPGSITFDSPGGATWQTRTSAQGYSQHLTLNAPANFDTQTDLTLTGPLTAAPGSSLTKLGPGTLTLPGGALAIPSVTVSAGLLHFPTDGTLATDALTISSANSASADLAGLPALSASPASLDTARQLLASAKLTPATPSPNHALAYTLTPNALSITLSLLGDANLDGQVDPDDYALLDRNFALHTPNPHWTDGDFNYDGTVDAADYLAIDTTYLSTHPASPDFLAQRESQFGAGYVQELLTSVPEPASPLLLATGYWLLSTSPPRRRRRRA